MTSPTLPPRDFDHCPATAEHCAGCVSALAAKIAKHINYSEPEALLLGSSWFGGWIPGPDVPVRNMGLQAAVIEQCRAHDLALLLLERNLGESDFHSPKPLRIHLMPDAPKRGLWDKMMWWVWGGGR